MNHTSKSFPGVLHPVLQAKRAGLFLLLWFPKTGTSSPLHGARIRLNGGQGLQEKAQPPSASEGCL